MIKDNEGEPYQQVIPADGWNLEYIEDDSQKDRLSEFVQNLINTPFDLSKDFMLRGYLIKLSEDEHELVIILHHIAADGWSASVLVKEVVELYEAYEEGRASKLAPLEIQYSDYAIWQRKYLSGETLDQKMGYWKKKLEDVSPLQLPTDHKRPAVQSIKGAVTGFTIDKELLSALHSLSREQGVTLFMTLLTAFKILLYRYSGQEDICVGTPIAGRQQHELEGLIGFFVNSLALRSEVKGDVSFLDLLKQVGTVTMEAYENQDVPFEKIVDEVLNERSLNRNPLFQVSFVLQNTPEIPQLRFGKIKLSRESFDRTSAKFDMTFFLNETPNGIQGSVEYSTDLYSEETIKRKISNFKNLLRSIVKKPQQRIYELPMLSKEEENSLLHEFNETYVSDKTDKNIIELFEAQVSKGPDRLAAVYGNEKLTFGQLNERANQLAAYLKSKGVTREKFVPICIEPSLNMLVGIWGILKAGGVYVPIDPEYPKERISYILKDTSAAIVLSSIQSVDENC